jgi:hypothetical protein
MKTGFLLQILQSWICVENYQNNNDGRRMTIIYLIWRDSTGEKKGKLRKQFFFKPSCFFFSRNIEYHHVLNNLTVQILAWRECSNLQ